MAENSTTEALAIYTADQTPLTITVADHAPVPEVGKGSINDMSDIHAAMPGNVPTPAMLLPIRAEKRYISENATAIVNNISQNLYGSQTINTPSTEDFYVSAAKRTFVDYVVVRIPHRGKDSNGYYSPNLTAEYRFLINPQTASVSRSTEDSQTFARGGWQFGIWGESLTTISLTGHSPGQYWSYGLTDGYAYFAKSWRNLQQLGMFFENNGYWFEGEESDEGPMAPGYTRRRIKKHQDVQLIVGNFVWSGMFDDFGYTRDAEHPYRAEFRLSFLAWRERFRASSPYWNSRSTTIQRGHSYGAYSYVATEVPSPEAGTQNGQPMAWIPPTNFAPATTTNMFTQFATSSSQPQALSLNFNAAGNPAAYASIHASVGGN